MNSVVIKDLNFGEITLNKNSESDNINVEIQDLSTIVGGFGVTDKTPASFPLRVGGVTALRALGGIGTAFLAGWEAGEWLNKNTPIQEWIQIGFDL